MRCFLLGLFGHFDRGVMMLGHHLKKRFVEVRVFLSAQHRHMHLHVLVGSFVRDFFRGSVVPTLEPAGHLVDLRLLL